MPPHDKFSFLLKLVFGLGVSIGVFYTGVQYALNPFNIKANQPAMVGEKPAIVKEKPAIVKEKPAIVKEKPAMPLTLAEFERLKIGMPLMHIEAILGRGVKIKQSQNSVTYRWQNSDSSRIIGEFDNRNQLINFRQEGLK